MSHMHDMLEFYAKFGHPVGVKPSPEFDFKRMHSRSAFLNEECAEFEEAMHEGRMDLMADALVDLVYVAMGTAVELGLHACWSDLWADVHRANMAKVKGTTHRGIAVDVMKPPGWEPPHTQEILEAYGYIERAGTGSAEDSTKLRSNTSSTIEDDDDA